MPMFIGPMLFVAFPFKGCRTGKLYLLRGHIQVFASGFLLFFFLPTGQGNIIVGYHLW
jgi:hypothetical protein